MKKNSVMRTYIIASLALLIVACTTRNDSVDQTDTQSGPIDASIATRITLDSLRNFSSEAELVKVFGQENIQRDQRYCPEGECVYTATVLFTNTTNQVEFTWADTTSFSGLTTVEVNTPGSEWKTANGIGIGTPLTTLEEMNGKPFSFAGFGWDYGGYTSWDDGKLANLNMAIRLEVPENATPEADSLRGDSSFQSDLPIARAVNPQVRVISLEGKKP